MMLKSLSTSARAAVLWLPFCYAFVSRYHWPRDFIINALTAWVPGVILVALLAGVAPMQAVWLYALGYLVFISLYEVGYLANDTYGLRHDPTPRKRVDLQLGAGFVIVFLVIRLATALVATWALGMLGNPVYWTALAVLGVTLVAHNTLRALEVKFFTFLQLSLLRFTLPILPALLVTGAEVRVHLVLTTGLLLFSLPRFLTYLDAKGRLSLPERKAVSYHLMVHVAVTPLLLVVSVLAAQAAPLVCLGWMVLVQLLYVLADRHGLDAVRALTRT